MINLYVVIKYFRWQVALLFLSYVLIVGTTTITAQSISLKVIELGQGWAGNTVNTVIFRHHGILTFGNYQFTAFYQNHQNLVFIQRNLRNNEVTTSTISGDFNIFDAHNSISLGIDAKGYLHVSYDHHGHNLRYQRSANPLDITEWSEPMQMTGVRERKVTYPAFVMNPIDSTLLFLYRDGSAIKGQACIKIYNVEQSEWNDLPTCILSGYEQKPWTSNPYWNHPVFDVLGRMHVSYVWRTRSVGYEKRTVINNIGIDYTYSNDNGNSWNTIMGYKQDVPITQVNSEKAWAIPVGTNLINQTSMSIDGEGHPHIAYYANDENGIPQYHHLRFDGKKWINNVVSNRSTKFMLAGSGTLQIPMSRPEIVIGSDNIVYIIFRADNSKDKMSATALYPPDYKYDESNTKCLWNESLGFAEPVIDRLRWNRENVLSMLIQYNQQPKGDKDVDNVFSPVFIVDWDLSALFNKIE